MRRMLSFAAIVLVAFATTAAGQPLQRAFVATYGSDANRCSLAAPCRTLASAAAQARDGGEVIVLDGGEYGPLAITQSIAIVGPGGVRAGIAVTSGAGISINAPGKHVRLEGLDLTSLGGNVGIRAEAADLVVIEGCTVAGFPDAGIRAGVGTVRVLVHDTTVRDNGTGIAADGAATVVIERSHLAKNAGAGARIGSGAVAALIDSVVAHNGTHGLLVQPATGAAKVAVVATLIAENAGDGIHATAPTSTTVSVSLSTSEVRRNANGLAADAATGATLGIDAEDNAFSDHAGAALSTLNVGGTVKVTLSGNVITRNGTGVVNTGALVETRGNNTFNYNGLNGGPLTALPGL